MPVRVRGGHGWPRRENDEPEIRGTVARIEEDTNYRFINAASQKYLNRDATAEERGSVEERVVIIVEPERVIPFPPQADTKES